MKVKKKKATKKKVQPETIREMANKASACTSDLFSKIADGLKNLPGCTFILAFRIDDASPEISTFTAIGGESGMLAKLSSLTAHSIVEASKAPTDEEEE